MLSLHTHQPLLIQLHATLYYRRNNTTTTNNNSSTATANTLNPFHSQKLPPVTFAADTVIPSPSFDSAINADSHITLNPHITLSSHSHTLDHNPTTPTTPNSNNNNTPTPSLTHSNPSHNRTGSRRGSGSTPPDLFLRSLDNSCLARVRAMTQHTAFCFERVVNYEVERAFVWAGVGAEGLVGASSRTRAAGTTGTTGTAGRMGMMGTMGLGSLEGMVEEGIAEESGVVAGAGAGAMATASLSMRGLSSTEIARQVDMMRRRGYRDWVRVEMAVEIEAGRELREREDVGWLTGVQGGEGEVKGWSE